MVLRIQGVYCPNCGEQSRCTGRRSWTCEFCRHRSGKPANVLTEAFSHKHKQVGEGLEAGMSPACAGHPDPDLWFSDEPASREARRSKEEQARRAITAMRICADCPIQQACLRYAMTDEDALRTGIWGGTFAFERVGAPVSTGKPNKPFQFQRAIRRNLIQLGLPCPTIPAELMPEYRPGRRKQLEPTPVMRKVMNLRGQGKSYEQIGNLLDMTAKKVESIVYNYHRRYGREP